MNIKTCLYLTLLTLFTLSKSSSFAQSNNNSPVVLAYFPSWSENWASNNQNSKLREIPSYVNHVFLAFAKPDLRYTKGSYDISQTGIQVPYNGCTLKESIGALNNKGIKVILSIGGETYWTSSTIYNDINYQQIKDLVDDLGFAGIDWDFEPNGSFANIGSATNVQHFIDFFTNSRAIMPRSQGYIMACAPSGVGALGGQTNDDPSSPFSFANRNSLTGETDAQLYQGTAATNGINLFGFSATGHMIPVMKAVGSEIDLIAFQGYNAGGSLNRSIMYDAYAHYAEQYGFNIAAGIHYPNEPWGPYYTYNHTNVAALSDHIENHPNRIGDGDGIMIWQLLMTGTNSSAYSYLNVASNVLNGTTQAAAINDANNFAMETYSGGADDCNGGSNGGGNGGGGAITYCGSSVYDNAIAYPSPNTNVYYQCKIWRNQWYANPNEVPGSNSVWAEVSTCTEDSSCLGNGGNGGGGVTYCGHVPYDNMNAYPIANTNVYYQCKIWRNQWYANPNEVPSSNPVWVEISTCNNDPNCATARLTAPKWSISNNIVSIQNISEKHTVYVFNALGQLHYTNITSSNITIDLNRFSIGSYWIIAIDSEGNRKLSTMVKIN